MKRTTRVGLLLLVASSPGVGGCLGDAGSDSTATNVAEIRHSGGGTETIEAAELSSAVLLIRDEDGVVHIDARSEHDMLFAQGWVTARDRLFQMDQVRRQGSGTLAELVGPDALPIDVQLRTLGIRRSAEASLPLASDRVRRGLDAYAAGVNAYVAENPLPPEYGALELHEFAPWTALDSLTIIQALGFSLSFDLADIDRTTAFLTFDALGSAFGFDGQALFFEDIARAAPFDDVATLPDAEHEIPGPTVRCHPGSRAHRGEELSRRFRDLVHDMPFFRDALSRERRPHGSNGWVVSGSHTRTGEALLANDPHLDLGTPSALYPVHLQARTAGFDVIGASVAGAPYVVIGNNDRVAWGATNNMADMTDVYQEQVAPDPASPSGLSIVHDGDLEPILPVPEQYRFNVIGDGVDDDLVDVPPSFGLPPVSLLIPRRNNGPIVSLDPGTGTAISIAHVGFSGGRELDGLRALNLASSVDDVGRAAPYLDAVSLNLLAADTQGNIGYFTTGEVPLREDLEAATVDGLPPMFIRNGTGGNDWIADPHPGPTQTLPFEILPVEEMPHVTNPPAGIIVNANNDPDGATLDNDPFNQLRPSGGIRYLSPRYAEGLRAKRISIRLAEAAASGGVTRRVMEDIQADVVLRDAEVFVPYILAAFARANEPGANPILAGAAADPRVVEAMGRFSAWDGSAPTGIAGGYDASDENGALSEPSPDEIEASIATTIYTAWRARFAANTVDAVLGGIFAAAGVDPGLPGDHTTLVALRHLLDDFDEAGGIGASGLDFFPVPGVADPRDRRDIILVVSLAEALDMLASDAFGPAFGGSTSQEDYRWGLLHRVQLPHLLGPPFSLSPPAGFPVDGGYGTVDVSYFSIRAASADGYSSTIGPSRRYVAQVYGRRFGPRGIVAQSSLPGGTGGSIDSPWFDNLLGPWLTNEAYPLRTAPALILRDRAEVVLLRP